MNWLRNFMMGRYGLDQMTVGILIVMMACTLLSSLTGLLLLYLLGIALMCWAVFRTLSRNGAARSRENQKFLVFWEAVKKEGRRVKNWFQTRRRRFADRKTHRYFRCPQCRQTLRVPKGRGKIEISCPHCRAKFIRKS